jgi:hypothetical protein
LQDTNPLQCVFAILGEKPVSGQEADTQNATATPQRKNTSLVYPAEEHSDEQPNATGNSRAEPLTDRLPDRAAGSSIHARLADLSNDTSLLGNLP